MLQIYKNGDSNELIRKVQSILKELGYNLTIDGDFGPETEDVIKEFQQKHKLNVDGLLDSKTLELIFLSAGYHPAECFINSLNLTSETKYLLWINQETNRVNLFKGRNRNWFLLCSYITIKPLLIIQEGLYKYGEPTLLYLDNYLENNVPIGTAVFIN